MCLVMSTVSSVTPSVRDVRKILVMAAEHFEEIVGLWEKMHAAENT